MCRAVGALIRWRFPLIPGAECHGFAEGRNAGILRLRLRMTRAGKECLAEEEFFGAEVVDGVAEPGG